MHGSIKGGMWEEGRRGSVLAFSLKGELLAGLKTIVMRVRERNVLFNDELNTFYLRLYGVRHMVMDHSVGEKGNPLSPHRLLIN